MNEDDKQLIASEMEAVAEDIRRLPNNPMDIQIDLVIQDLFEIMVQLRGFKK